VVARDLAMPKEKKKSRTIVCAWVKLSEDNFLAVSVQVDKWFFHIFGKSLRRRNSPNFGTAVIRACGNDLVVEWVKITVKNGTSVASDLLDTVIKFTKLGQWDDSQSATSTRTGGGGKEFVVGLDVVVITSGGRKTEAEESFFFLVWLAEQVADFGGTNETRHFFNIFFFLFFGMS